jgi:hypothetical protein
MVRTTGEFQPGIVRLPDLRAGGGLWPRSEWSADSKRQNPDTTSDRKFFTASVCRRAAILG